jgi:hypothetical protein
VKTKTIKNDVIKSFITKKLRFKVQGSRIFVRL